MITKLYLICAESPDGENLDLFVSARDDLEAVAIWTTTFDITAPLDEYSPRLIEVPAVSETPQAHSWQGMRRIKPLSRSA